MPGEETSGRDSGTVRRPATTTEAQGIESLLTRLASSPAIQSLIAEKLAAEGTPIAVKRSLLAVIEHSGLQQLPESWIAALVSLLGNGTSDLREETIRVVHNATSSHSRIEPLGAALQRIAADESLSDETRLAALGAIPGGPGELGPGQFAYVIRFLDEHAAPANHSAAIDALAARS